MARLNQVTASARLTPGTVVFVPAVTGKEQDAEVPTEEIVVVPPGRFAEPGRRRVFYRTLAGDQLTEVAAAFGAAPSEIARWNGLDPIAKLQAGMSLQAFVPLSFDLSRVRHLGEHEVRVLITGTEEFFEYFEAQNGRKRLFVRAGKGETLATIGRRYKMSAGMMERINRIPSSTVIPEGDTVVVYAPSGTDGATAALEASEPLAAIRSPAPDALPKLSPSALPGSPNGARAVPSGNQ
jgi:membrane-bound lytic murein transglycosylase D